MNGFEKFAAKAAGIDANEYQAFLEFKAANIVEVAEVTETDEVKVFGSASLEDGTVIYFPGDELSEGSIVYSDEEQTEAVGASDWTLENGDVVTTGEDGTVTSIEVTDAPEEDDSEGDEDLGQEGISEEMLIILAEFNSRLEALEALNQSLSEEKAKLETEKGNLEVELEAKTKDNVKLSKTSAATPNVAVQAKGVAPKAKHKLRGFNPIN